jgi:hypothetical protein
LYLDLGIEDLLFSRRVPLEHLMQPGEVDRLEPTIRVEAPKAKGLTNDLHVLPGHRPSIPG